MRKNNSEILQRVGVLEAMLAHVQDELVLSQKRIAELETAGQLVDQLFAVLERNRLDAARLH